MKNILFAFLILTFISTAAESEQRYKVGIFGGFSRVDYASGLPDRFEDADDTRWGAYTGLTGGLGLTQGEIDTGLEVTPIYLLSGVEGSQLHSLMLPVFGTASVGSGSKLVAGLGTGPILTDMFKTDDFGWGIFAKLSAMLNTSEDYGGNIGPQVQIFTDISTSGENIRGLLFGLNYETFITR